MSDLDLSMLNDEDLRSLRETWTRFAASFPDQSCRHAEFGRALALALDDDINKRQRRWDAIVEQLEDDGDATGALLSEYEPDDVARRFVADVERPDDVQ